MSPLVVVMLGTDHHPFHRLVGWADQAARRHPEGRVVVQHGASPAPTLAEGHAYLRVEELRRLLAEADAVACHGGPGAIMDAREAGHVPICVPRNPALGEHVDAHQLRFATLVDRAGVVRRATDEQRFHELLEAALARDPASRQAAAPTSTATREARSRLALELDDLARGRRRRAG